MIIMITIACILTHKRLLLAALHFNENFDRAQDKPLDGNERIHIVFPEQKKGKFTAKPIPVAMTFNKYIFTKTTGC